MFSSTPVNPTYAVAIPITVRDDVPRGHDSRLGIFINSLGNWRHFRQTVQGMTFVLVGRGSNPTNAQIQIWDEIEPQLTDMVDAAIHAVPTPLVPAPKIDHAMFMLSEVRLESDGTVHIFLDHPVCESISCWPQIIFSKGRILEAVWTA